MAATENDCPAPEMIEGLALGQGWTPEMRAHVEACSVCREKLQRIQDDNGFLLGFATDGAFSTREHGDFPREFSIPGYQFLREIHHGGQGVVWLARQHSTKRHVAVKLMRQGPFATLADRARFDREVEVLGRLSHPNIVAVHDAGSVAGYQYFVMDYVEGVSLGEALAQRALQTERRTDDEADPSADTTAAPIKRDIRAALAMLIQVCDAVHAAHVRGIIHRDLKPSNIQLDRDRVPHVLDFGLAKSTVASRETAVTRSGQFVGSLPWAAPEQVEGLPSRVDLRTDVYALGAILFQLLAGDLPFPTEGSLREAIESIVAREPPKPSDVATRTAYPPVDDELDTIILKCLSKDRDRRYQTAGELAAELRRYMAGEAIEAKRDSAVYVLRKALRRNRFPVAAGTLFVVLIGLFGAVMTMLYRHSAELEKTATRSAASLANLLSQSNIEQGRLAGMLGSMELAEQLLWDELLLRRDPHDGATFALHDPPGPPEAYWGLCELYRRFPCRRSIHFERNAASTARMANDGASVWIADATGRIRLLNETGEAIDTFRVAVPNHNGIVMVNQTGTTVAHFDGSRCRVWRRTDLTGSVAEFPLEPGRSASGFRLSPSGRRIVGLLRGEAVVWDVDSQEAVARFAAEEGTLVAVASSRDDRHVVARDDHGKLILWDVSTGHRVAAVRDENPSRENLHALGELDFSADGSLIADAWIDTPGRIWRWKEEPSRLTRLAKSPGDYRVQAFNHDGKTLAVADLGGAVHLYDTATGACRSAFVADSGRIRTVAFTKDGQALWTCSDTELRLWDVASDGGVRIVDTKGDALHSVAVSPDGAKLIAGGGMGLLHTIDSTTLDRTTTHTGAESTISCIAFAPDGKQAAAGTYANTVLVWNPGETPWSLRTIPHPNRISSIAFSPDSTLIATACDDGNVRIFRTDDLQPVRTLPTGDRVPQIAFHPSGELVAAAVRDGTLLVWNTESGAATKWSESTGKPLRAVAFSSDGNWLFSSGARREITVWDVEHRKAIAALTGHSQEVYAIAVHPSEDIIATGDAGGQVRLWNARLRRPLATLDGHRDAVMSLRFSNDGRLVTASLDETVRVWDLGYFVSHIAGNVEKQLRRLNSGDFDPDGAARWRKWRDAVLAHTDKH